MEQRFYSPHEIVVKSGEEGTEMFIISHGHVEVTQDETILATLKEGQFFGESALIEHTVRNADVISQNYCDLYVLSKEDFLEVTQKFPNLLKRFAEVHRLRKKKIKRAA